MKIPSFRVKQRLLETQMFLKTQYTNSPTGTHLGVGRGIRGREGWGEGECTRVIVGEAVWVQSEGRKYSCHCPRTEPSPDMVKSESS